MLTAIFLLHHAPNSFAEHYYFIRDEVLQFTGRVPNSSSLSIEIPPVIAGTARSMAMN